MQDPKKLRVWHLAHDLALRVVAALPPGKASVVPNLRSQTVRAATSIAWNIAEGCAQESRPKFVSHLETALGSGNELETQLLFARDAKVLSEMDHADLTEGLGIVRKMLLSLIRKVRKRIAEDERAERKEQREPGTQQQPDKEQRRQPSPSGPTRETAKTKRRRRP